MNPPPIKELNRYKLKTVNSRGAKKKKKKSKQRTKKKAVNYSGLIK